VSIRLFVADDPEQYVKQEVSEVGEHGRIAKATRLITERASTRIGKMACEIALQRPRKVCPLFQLSSIRAAITLILLVVIHPSILPSNLRSDSRVVFNLRLDSHRERQCYVLAFASWS